MRIALIITLLTFTGSVFAQTSGSFLLRGSVAKVCNIAVTADAAATALDLIGAGHTNTQVATFTSSSNSSAGMRLDINADTAGVLVNQSSPTDTIAYTVDYTNTLGGTSAAGITPVVAAAAMDTRPGAGPINGSIGINVTADPTLVDGNYEANITLSCVTL